MVDGYGDAAAYSQVYTVEIKIQDDSKFVPIILQHDCNDIVHELIPLREKLPCKIQVKVYHPKPSLSSKGRRKAVFNNISLQDELMANVFATIENNREFISQTMTFLEMVVVVSPEILDLKNANIMDKEVAIGLRNAIASFKCLKEIRMNNVKF